MVTSSSSQDVALVLDATSATDLFGANKNRARIRYRRLARSVHPDMGGSEDAMARLNRLWDEYNRTEDSHSDGNTPIEVTRNDQYAIFKEHDKLLVVERLASDSIWLPHDVSDIKKRLDTTPVCMLELNGSKYISQGDGLHVAYICDAPDNAKGNLIMLESLKDRLPGGVLHPRDLAWITKRVLFLEGVLSSMRRDLHNITRGLAIDPVNHMLVIVSPWEILGMSDAHTLMARVLLDHFLACIVPVTADDKRSNRIKRFVIGARMDRVTGWGDIMREYDDLLEELFGQPRFHVMEVI